jgi:hypothetical protein
VVTRFRTYTDWPIEALKMDDLIQVRIHPDSKIDNGYKYSTWQWPHHCQQPACACCLIGARSPIVQPLRAATASNMGLNVT